MSAKNAEFVSVPFDLSQSLDDQLERVRKRLTSFKKALKKRKDFGGDITKRKQVKLYKKYLRVLDGAASVASHSDMAKILSDKENIYPDFTGNKDIENWKKAATKLRDFDYYFLPTL